MAKVRCVWVDGPSRHGFQPGMVFEVEGFEERVGFRIGKVVYAKRKGRAKLGYTVGQHLPFNGYMWKFKLVE